MHFSHIKMSETHLVDITKKKRRKASTKSFWKVYGCEQYKNLLKDEKQRPVQYKKNITRFWK